MGKALRIGGIILVALILAGAGALFLRQRVGPAVAEATPSASTAVVTRGSIEETVGATGNVAAERQVTLTFGSSGTIAQVLAAKGEEVEAGQVLASLDTESLEWQIARSQAAVDTAQTRLEQAKQPAGSQDLASAQAALDNALANLDNVRAGPSEEDLRSAQSALDSAKASYKKVKAGPTKEDLAAAEASLESARAQVQQAQAAYDRVKHRPDVQMTQEALNLQNATISLEQAQANYDTVANRPTASELAAAEAQVAQAEAQLAQLLARPTANELASAEAQVAQAEAQLAQLQERPKVADVAVFEAQLQEAAVSLAQAQSQLEDAVITAPFAGVLLAVQVREGEWATPGAPAFVLAATESLILEVNVDEVDVAQLQEGQIARLSFDALEDQEVAGTVTYIAPASTNVGGAVAYGVEVSFSPGELPIRLGMTASVDLVVADAEGALLVPNQAIVADRAARRYYVEVPGPDGTSERLEVTIGLRNESQTQILAGLNEGDVVMLGQVPEQSQSEPRFGPGGAGGGPFGGGR